jgi:rubrerythrin
MKTECTLDEILDMAIDKEIEAQQLYKNLSEQVEADAVKDAFLEIAKQEKMHQNVIERYKRGDLKKGVLSKGKTLDYKIAEHFDEPEILVDMQLKDVFLLAANREKKSHELYLALAAIHPQGEAKKLLKELASQELEHKQRVEFLYTEVAFPQTAGG